MLAGTLQLRALNVKRRVLEYRVLAAVVEVKVTVDHDLDVGRAEVVLCQRIGGVTVHDPPLADELSGPSHAGVDQDRTSPRVLDHKPVDRYVIELADPREVEPNDLQLCYGMNGETAKTVNNRATYTIE